MVGAQSTPPPEDNRRRLLDAALTILREEGAAALTVRNITDRAGCSTSGIYTWFGGKQGLVDSVFIEGFDSFGRAMGQAYTEGDLVTAGQTYRSWALANPMHYLVMFGRAVPDYEPSEEALARASSAFDGLVAALARAGADDAEVAAYHLYATVHGYVMLELMGLAPMVDADPAHLYQRALHHLLPH